MKLKLVGLLVVAVIMAIGSFFAEAKVIHVPADYPTIQAGIDAAVAGDQVVVAAGTYTGTGNKNLDFKGRAITVESENGAEKCVIDCENKGRGFYFHSDETNTSVISGFTIRNGYASGNWPDNNGGGVYCENSSPTVTNVIITRNTAVNDGGGVYCSYSSPTLTNVIFTENLADYGAAIFCDNSFLALVNNVIVRNMASYRGGGIFCHYSSPMLINTTVAENIATTDGGGIFCHNNSSPVVINTILWEDTPQEVCFNGEWAPNSITISYSDIRGGLAGIITNDNGVVNWGPGNIDADPLFVNPDNSDYHLQFGSPCIDAGTPIGAPVDDIEGNPRDEFPDMGAYEYQAVSTGSITGTVTDTAGNPIKGALVIAILGETKIKASTDSNGYYQILDLEPGVYLALCVKKGYKPGIKKAEVIAGQNTEVNFKLKQ